MALLNSLAGCKFSLCKHDIAAGRTITISPGNVAFAGGVVCTCKRIVLLLLLLRHCCVGRQCISRAGILITKILHIYLINKNNKTRADKRPYQCVCNPSVLLKCKVTILVSFNGCRRWPQHTVTDTGFK